MDKWLWHARFFKTRTLASRIVTEGRVRVNGDRVSKPSTAVGPSDTLTFAWGQHVRVVRIVAIGARRGPAPEAQALYEDLTEQTPASPQRTGPRPTKRDRRSLNLLRKSDLSE
ncbi:MAG: RNA-binding S4 domain-containing protein [Pseudomonadota bacterium]